MLKSIGSFLIVSFFVIASFGCGEESISNPEQSQTEYEGTILAIGDSLTEGLGVEEEFTYPALLQHKLIQNGFTYQVINAGVSGETSSGTLSRMNWALTLKPDIVILVTGANDGLRGIDPELIQSNITKVVQMLKDRNIVVVLGGMQMVKNLGQDYTSAFSNIYPHIAKTQDILFIPFFLTDVGGRSDLNQPDGIHPTADGYRIIVDNIYSYVVEAIQKHQSQ
jgi:acyl-CoA thioesterase-1